ncbi:NnrS family protein [Anaeromyxobacter sp. Fw109-5]|uniref:NnrS family protein n=1 Tax=Anaeromyxobacter sp. (strain Fw109-5) TaxID=404589 RepID=UPI00130516B1|nr:NnrS family protein [Anaeromyxobacter sp. Fw109-5]
MSVTARHLEAPPWRREPYRLFFPLGAALGAIGVGDVLRQAMSGAVGESGLAHSLALIQGFMTAFATGFLFTFVPRRTGTRAPAAWQMALAAGAPVAAVLLHLVGRSAAGHAAWLAGIAVLAGFAARRLASERALRRVPAVFAWVPAALLLGAGGAIASAIAPRLGPWPGPQVWALGRGMLVQGLVTGLVLGVGGILLPQLTRGEAPPDALEPGANRRAALRHGALALAFLASFPLEIFRSALEGLALRAAVAGAVLLGVARIHRAPSAPGLHRGLVWLSAWLLLAGYLLAAIFPKLRGAALHLTFVGGFALMTLAVSIHVAVTHGGRPERLAGSPAPVRAVGLLVLAATAARLLAGIDRARLQLWLAVAAVLFLGALASWAALVLPALFPRAPSAPAPRTGRSPSTAPAGTPRRTAPDRG